MPKSLFALLFSAGITGLVWCANPGPAGGIQQPDVSIKTQSSEVLVDAVVTDKTNRIVTNLKPEDFILYENGVRQEIRSFRLVYMPSPSAGPRKPPAEPAAAQPAITESLAQPQTQAPPLNVMAILLDYATTEFVNQKLVREAAIKYVQEKLRPTDFIAVFALSSSLHILSDFTNDKQKLVAALKTTDVRGSAFAAEVAGLDAAIADARGAALDNDSTAVSVPSGPGGVAAGGARSAQGSSQAIAMIAARIEAQYVALQSAVQKQQTREVLTAIRAIALGLSHIEGRKSLILFSQGFVVGEQLEDELHAVANAANRSHVAIYSIDSRGLTNREMSGGLAPKDELTAVIAKPQRQRMEVTNGESIFDRVLEVGRDVKESALRYISNATGGQLIRNTNDLSLGLARVDEEEHSYYLLSYRPGSSSNDGKFHEIRVEVRHPGFSVRARSGYYAIPAEYDFLTPEEYDVVSLARAPSTRLPLFIRAAGFRGEQNRYRVPVILEIPAGALKFEKVGNGNVTRLHIVGIVRDSSNNLVARFGGRREFSATDSEYKVLLPGALSFLDTVGLPTGSYSIQVAVKDQSSAGSATQELALVLPPPSKEFALSSILLAKAVEKGSSSASQFLMVNGAQILPSARCDFRNGDNLVFYFDIYDPQMRNDKPDVEVTLWLMSNGRRLPVKLPSFTLDEPGGDGRLTLARFVQLAGLAPGEYMLVAEARDRIADRTVQGHASFSVSAP